MAFSIPAAVAADPNNIQIQLPAAGDRDWGTGIRDLCFILLANHDHGAAGGQPISGASLGPDSVDGAKILLENDTYLRWKNFAGVTTNVIKLAADDKVEIDPQVDLLVMSNNIAVQARNAADSGTVSLIKADASDNVVVGENALLTLETEDATLATDNQTLKMQKETLADNTSVATAVPNFPVLAIDESAIITAIMIRNGESQVSKIIIDINNFLLVEEVVGDDVGVTFSNNAGQLEYVTTSTGFAVTLKLISQRG